MKYALALVALMIGTIGSVARPAEPAHITSIWMSQSDARPGDVVHGRVTTTKSTASIEVRVGGYGTSLKKVNLTTFVGDIRVPHVPFFLKRRWTVRIIARDIVGTINDERDTSISIH